MADKPAPFNAQIFLETVQASLIAGMPTERLDRMLRRMAAESGEITFPRLCLIAAQACLDMGRTKQVRHWLERLLEEIEDEDIFAAVAVAVGSSQAELAVDLYRKLLTTNQPPNAEESLAVAQATVALALRLRLPMRG